MVAPAAAQLYTQSFEHRGRPRKCLGQRDLRGWCTAGCVHALTLFAACSVLKLSRFGSKTHSLVGRTLGLGSECGLTYMPTLAARSTRPANAVIQFTTCTLCLYQDCTSARSTCGPSHIPNPFLESFSECACACSVHNANSFARIGKKSERCISVNCNACVQAFNRARVRPTIYSRL